MTELNITERPDAIRPIEIPEKKIPVVLERHAAAPPKPPAPPKRKPAPKRPAKVVYDAAYLHGVLKHYRLVLREPFGRAFVVGTGEGETIELRGFPENVPGRRDEWDFFDPPTLFIADRAYPVTNP